MYLEQLMEENSILWFYYIATLLNVHSGSQNSYIPRI